MKGQDFVEGRDTIGEMYKLWADASDLLIDTIKLKKAYLSAVFNKMPESELIEKFKEDYNLSESSTKSLINEVSSLKDQDAVNGWIAPWPSYYTGFVNCNNNKDNVFICQFSQSGNKLNIIIDFDRKESSYSDYGLSSQSLNNLKDAVIRLAVSKELREKMGKEARRFMIENFGHEVVAAKFKEFFHI